MPRTVYLRPIGLAAVPDRSRIDEVRGCLPLAGSRHLDFTGVEVLQRSGAEITLKTTSIGELNETDWGRHAGAVSQFFNALVMPRPAMAALPMNRTHIMGIVNVTPDSFSDGGRHATKQAAIDQALRDAAAHGYCASLGDLRTEINSIAAPLTLPGGEHVAVNCGGPAFAFPETRLREEIAPRLLATARAIAADVGGSIRQSRAA